METLILVDQQARTYEITMQTGWTVGRDPSNSLVLNDIKVSRKHAVVRWESDGFSVVDLGSRNGTFVNSHRIERFVLSDGDIVRIGDTELLARIGTQKHVDEEVLSQKRQISSLETHVDMEEEFRVHETGFSGSLKTLSMVEVIQTIMHFGKDGHLEVTDDHDVFVAEAWFLNGEVIHASYDDETGIQAMYRIVNLDNGLFEFSNDIPSPERTIAQPTMGILLEACKRHDENGR